MLSAQKQITSQSLKKKDFKGEKLVFFVVTKDSTFQELLIASSAQKVESDIKKMVELLLEQRG